MTRERERERERAKERERKRESIGYKFEQRKPVNIGVHQESDSLVLSLDLTGSSVSWSSRIFFMDIGSSRHVASSLFDLYNSFGDNSFPMILLFLTTPVKRSIIPTYS